MRMRHALAARGIEHGWVTIHLRDKAVKKKTRPEVVEECADLIQRNFASGGNWSSDWRVIRGFSRDLSTVVRHINGWNEPPMRLGIGLAHGAYVPHDGALIEATVLEKGKYPPALKAKMTLVIGAAWLVDFEQVNSYIASGKASTIGFREAWIVIENRAYPLKTDLGSSHSLA